MLNFFRSRLSRQRKFLKDIRTLTGVKPSNYRIYEQAFTHRSAIKNKGETISNERLEFLGDAVLDIIVSDFLFHRFPDQREGYLTQMRSKIVSRENLNEVAVELGIHKFVQTGFETTPNTSLFGNALEALIGAIYIDRGYHHADKFIREKIIDQLLDLEELMSREISYKSRLLEWAQKERKSVQFKLVSETGPQHKRQYSIEVVIENETFGQGVDYSKKKAEQSAAKSAMEKLNQ